MYPTFLLWHRSFCFSFFPSYYCIKDIFDCFFDFNFIRFFWTAIYIRFTFSNYQVGLVIHAKQSLTFIYNSGSTTGVIFKNILWMYENINKKPSKFVLLSQKMSFLLSFKEFCFRFQYYVFGYSGFYFSTFSFFLLWWCADLAVQ